MKHNKITISILMIFVILLSVGCSNNQENISDGNENVNADYDFLFQELEEKYDIYYRVHSARFGWLGWTKNGAKAGTEGMSKRMEGIQIQLVEKGKPGPSSGQTAFRTK